MDLLTQGLARWLEARAHSIPARRARLLSFVWLAAAAGCSEAAQDPGAGRLLTLPGEGNESVLEPPEVDGASADGGEGMVDGASTEARDAEIDGF